MVQHREGISSGEDLGDMHPYFEKRNIHFCLNRCGFCITEFFHPHHRDPNDHDDDSEMFRFEKKMF